MSAGYHFKVRVGVVLLKDDQLLLARQNKMPFWVLPGGTLEPGEGLGETAVRELMEEANLTIEVVQPLYFGDFIKPGPPIRQTVDMVFLGRYLSGDLQMSLDENLDEMAFFPLEQVKSMPIQPVSVASSLIEDWESGRLHQRLGLDSDTPAGISCRYLGKYG